MLSRCQKSRLLIGMAVGRVAPAPVTGTTCSVAPSEIWGAPTLGTGVEVPGSPPVRGTPEVGEPAPGVRVGGGVMLGVPLGTPTPTTTVLVSVGGAVAVTVKTAKVDVGRVVAVAGCRVDEAVIVGVEVDGVTCTVGGGRVGVNV